MYLLFPHTHTYFFLASSLTRLTYAFIYVLPMSRVIGEVTMMKNLQNLLSGLEPLLRRVVSLSHFILHETF